MILGGCDAGQSVFRLAIETVWIMDYVEQRSRLRKFPSWFGDSYLVLFISFGRQMGVSLG